MRRLGLCLFMVSLGTCAFGCDHGPAEMPDAGDGGGSVTDTGGRDGGHDGGGTVTPDTGIDGGTPDGGNCTGADLCTTAGTSCSGNMLVTCAAAADGCLRETASDCTTT